MPLETVHEKILQDIVDDGDNNEDSLEKASMLEDSYHLIEVKDFRKEEAVEQGSDKLFFEAVGSYGCYQRTIFAVFFCSYIFGEWSNFAMTFLAPKVQYTCVLWSNNESFLPYSNSSNQCYRELVLKQNVTNSREVVKCIRWEYNETEEAQTLVSKFDLVCDREWLISFSKSVYMFGFMTSVFVCGQLSDWMGRRRTIIVGYLIGCFSQFLVLFTNSLKYFLFLRFFQAFGIYGYNTTGFVLLLELVGFEHRTQVGCFIQVGSSIGVVLLTGVGYFASNWFQFSLIVAIPEMLLAFCYKAVPESPRWLIMRQKTKELEELIQTAAKRNGMTPPEPGLSKHLINTFRKERQKAVSGTVLDVFKNSRMRRRIMNVMYAWVVTSFIYYGISYNTNDLAGDPFFNYALAGILEIPAYSLVFFIGNAFGRRRSLIGLMLSCSMASVVLIVVRDPVEVTMILSMVIKFCITSLFGLIYLYTGELFPTIVRTSSLGVCSTAARIGSIVAPFVTDLAHVTYDYVPFLLYSVLSMLCGIAVLWLPETAEQNLWDTIEEEDSFLEVSQTAAEKQSEYRKHKRWRCQC